MFCYFLLKFETHLLNNYVKKKKKHKAWEFLLRFGIPFIWDSLIDKKVNRSPEFQTFCLEAGAHVQRNLYGQEEEDTPGAALCFETQVLLILRARLYNLNVQP